MRTILFVCTGNTCRSPMAEAIARNQLSKGPCGLDDLFVASAGVATVEGIPPSVEAMVVLESTGIELDGFSTPLSAEMVEKAEVVFCMTASHVETTRSLVEKSHHEKIVQLDPSGDVEDPIGRDEAAYHALMQRLEGLIAARLEDLVHEDRNRS